MTFSMVSPAIDRFLEPSPYENVHVHQSDWAEGSLTIGATFDKTDCELKTFAVVGFDREIPEYLEYTDLDEVPEFDREKGSHSLHIVVDLEDKFFDAVEIRTRHECTVEDEEGNLTTEIVQRVFAHVEYEE
eukprot:GHVU01114436.1.p2 GENE.GHVU01114436.1~~GHVU01114436.1.p2  ORF type:complete len:131 (-),score=16.65 GHVU01114436.1:346-738(-)